MRNVIGALLALLLLTGAGGLQIGQGQSGVTVNGSAQSQQCRIKGNISSKGERIYHTPGGRWYDKTKISPLKGERWFCSEAEAQKAGWRRSKQ